MSRWERLLVSSFIPHVFVLVCSSSVFFFFTLYSTASATEVLARNVGTYQLFGFHGVRTISSQGPLIAPRYNLSLLFFTTSVAHTDTVWWRERGFAGVDRHAAWIQIYRSIKPMICDDGRDGMSQDALMGFQRRYCTRRRSSMVLEKTAPTAPLTGRRRKVNAGPQVYDEGLIDWYIPRSLLYSSAVCPRPDHQPGSCIQKIDYKQDVSFWLESRSFMIYLSAFSHVVYEIREKRLPLRWARNEILFYR